MNETNPIAMLKEMTRPITDEARPSPPAAHGNGTAPQMPPVPTR